MGPEDCTNLINNKINNNGIITFFIECFVRAFTLSEARGMNGALVEGNIQPEGLHEAVTHSITPDISIIIPQIASIF